MLTVLQAIKFFDLDRNGWGELAMSLLFSEDMLVRKSKVLQFDDFACLAFLNEIVVYLNESPRFLISDESKTCFICSRAFPKIREAVATYLYLQQQMKAEEITKPLIILLFNDRYLTIGDEQWNREPPHRLTTEEAKYAFDNPRVTVAFFPLAIAVAAKHSYEMTQCIN